MTAPKFDTRTRRAATPAPGRINTPDRATFGPAALRRAGLAGLALLALAACDPSQMPGGASPSRAKVTVAGRPVVVAAPAGFCVDADSTRVSADGAFVLMSDCALLGMTGGAGPAGGGALTVAVSSGALTGEGDASGALEDIAEFARTAEGRALLGRSGRADRVRILTEVARGDVLYLLIEDRGSQPVAGIDRQFWRAFLEVNDRMTVLTELGFAGGESDPRQGFEHLSALARAMQAANPPG